MKTISRAFAQSEILIFSDGKIFAHNITPEMAAILCELDPENESMRQRACSVTSPAANRRSDEMTK